MTKRGVLTPRRLVIGKCSTRVQDCLRTYSRQLRQVFDWPSTVLRVGFGNSRSVVEDRSKRTRRVPEEGNTQVGKNFGSRSKLAQIILRHQSTYQQVGAMVNMTLNQGGVALRALKPYTIYLTALNVLFCVCLARARQSSSPEADHGVAFQKSYPITGTVLNAADDTPLDGATISIKGRQNTVLTYAEGKFRILATDSTGVLVISYVGYQTAEIPFTKSNNNPLTIRLESNGAQLEEVQVSTGYQTLPKERATGSFATPDGEMLNGRVSTDVLSRLNGITSGVLFNREGGISVRGQSTIFANDQPLIVVDNFPYSGDITNINPNDVENITVLKDAAAASIWGARAGNGVIVITTRSGRSKDPLNVSVNSNVTIGKKSNLFYAPNYFSSPDFIEVERFLFTQGKYENDAVDQIISPVISALKQNGEGTLPDDDLSLLLADFSGRDVREQALKHFYRNPIMLQNALSFRGGTGKSTYYMSAGYDRNLAELMENSFDRITINTLNTFETFRKFVFTVGLNYVQTSTKSDNTFSNTMNLPGYFPYTQFFSDGKAQALDYAYNRSFVDDAPTKGFLDWSYVPLHELGLTDNKSTANDIRINTAVKYTLTKGLDVEGRYQYQKFNQLQRTLNGTETYFARDMINRFSMFTDGTVSGYNVPVGAILSEGNGIIRAHNIRGQMTYNNSWALHQLNVLAGVEWMDVSRTRSSFVLYGYDDDVATFSPVNFTETIQQNPLGNYAYIPNGTTVSGGVDRFRSYFANASYSYKGRYILSGSTRIDASNYFGVTTNQKKVPLWSVGTKWLLSDEPFYNLSWLPYMNIRLTYGYNGNLDRSVTGLTTFLYRTNATLTALPYARISNVGNPELRWEKIGILNLGLDFRNSNGRLSGSLEYYRKRGRDLIGDAVFAPSSGISLLRGNYSNMAGNGMDIQFQGAIVDKPVKWSANLLVSYNTDQVTRYDVPNTNALNYVASNNYPIVGKPVYSLYSYQWAGLNPETGNPMGYDGKGEISEDYATLTQQATVDAMVYNGRIRPPWFGGLVNTLSYRGLSVSFNISFKLGHYFRRPALSYSQLFGTKIIGNSEYVDRWQKPGDEMYTNVPSLQYPANAQRDRFYQYSEVTVEKADHIRLQDITIGYDLKTGTDSNLPVKNLRIYAYLNNVGLLWKANNAGYDPDFITYNGSVQGYPPARTFALGFKMDF
ncbi:SusC/RagA family TonB-linked outer membrane protein [Olivibacter sp. CPCC 100613]|uniref:SusC/RagA family TonB-linked outer membrane protein n=1 Tax=Olivibacter sp. CPCC 100613 TaxID=3079931 RepID=UPI002FFB14F6